MQSQFEPASGTRDFLAAEYEEREQTKAWAAHTGHNASATHRCYLALDLWLLGFVDQALQLDRETCALAREIGHPFTIEHAVDFSACLSHYCRLGGAVQAAAEEELAIATDQGFQLWHALGTLHKGVGILLQGSPEAALPIMLKGFSAFRATGAGVRVHYYLGILADAYTQLGRHAEARQALDEGLAIAVKSDDRFFEAELHRLKGELLLIAPGDAVAAEACFRQAIEIARSQYSRAWELRAAMSLARLRQRQGRGDEGCAELAAVYGTFTEGFTTPDLIDATALLQGLSTA